MLRFLAPRWWPFWGAVALLFYLSSVENGVLKGNDPFKNFDKYAHFTAFAGISAMLALGISTERWKTKYLQTLIAIVVIGMIVAGLDEFHQSFVKGRSVSLMDWCADVGGVCFTTLVFAIWKKRKSPEVLREF